MKKIIEIDESTRIRRCDPLNWTVDVYAESKSKDGVKSMKWRQASGAGHGPYFGKVEHAFRWLLDYMTERDMPEATDMKGYLATYERTAKKLIAVAKEVG